MRAVGLVWALAGFLLGEPALAHGAGNPVVEALTQGTVVQFSGQEAVSQPFQFDVTMAVPDKALSLSMAVGQPIAVTVMPGRLVTGMIQRIEQIDGPGLQGLYRLHIVPALQRLQYRTGSRTFYAKNVADVAMQLLNEAGIAPIEVRTAATLPIEEMLVQYQESDLDFISRLIERVGIHYHFEPTPAGEKLVLSDGNSGFPVSVAGKVTFGQTAGPSVVSFTRGQALHAGQIQAGDYNWKTPAVDLTAAVQAPSFGDLTERLFPAGVETKPESQTAAATRLAARVSAAQSCGGDSTYPQLQAGTRVFLTGHPRLDFNQEYVITAVEHQRSGKEYRNTFHCIPAQIPFRPLPSTPVPLVAGVVPALVIGPPGETRHVDQFGRVKVRFPWRSPGHTNPTDPGDAGFVRVAQVATGVGASAMWLPDVGDEVLVAFEHGDLRRPVVIGSVYNGKDMPPAALPANKHLSMLRSQGAGGTKTELVYDGTPGGERLLIQSGQNGLTLSASGITLHGPSVSISSTGDLIQRAGRAMTVEAGGDLAVKAGQNAALTVVGATQFNGGETVRTAVGGDAHMAVGANLHVTVGAATIMDGGKDVTIRSGQNLLVQVARAARLTAGEDTLIQTGRSLVANSAMFQFVATQTGTIQAARGLIVRTEGDLDLLGKDIDAKASGNLTLKGAKITQN